VEKHQTNFVVVEKLQAQSGTKIGGENDKPRSGAINQRWAKPIEY